MAERASAIERGFFRKADDGGIVFFPWGLTQRGYRLPGEAARRKAARAASLLIGSVLVAATWGGRALHEVLEREPSSLEGAAGALAAPLGVIAFALLAYWLWVSRFVEGFPASDLRVSREERLQQAAELAPWWNVVLVGGLLAALSALLMVLEPRLRWLGALGIALGLGLAMWGRVLHRYSSRNASR